MKYTVIGKQLNKKDNFKFGKHISVSRRETKSFPLHSHSYFEIEIILSGCGIQRINGTVYPISRGSVYLLSPADFHEVEIKEKSEQWNIVFDETVLNTEITDRIYSIASPCVVLDEKSLEKADRVSSLILMEAADGDMIIPLIEYLLGVAFKVGKSADRSPVKRAQKYIETYYRENPSLSDTSRVVSLTPQYFSSIFKKETGLSYTDYLNRRKIECACLLLDGGFSVKHACSSSGFRSMSTFLYAFKKETGVSPSEYKINK